MLSFSIILPRPRLQRSLEQVLAIVATIPDSIDIQVSLCEKLIEWCEAEKRTFLKQRIEAKYSNLLWLKKQPTKALEIVNALLGELKKLDDKQMLTEVHLTESRIYETLENIPKSKAFLTAARSAANSIYVVPLLQAELDEMSGILCCEEQDYTTSFSYFQEAYDAYDSQKDGRAVAVLKYMCLAKVLNDTPKEVFALLNSKIGLKHTGPGLEALNAIAVAVKDRSLKGFEAAVKAHAQELKTDDLISHHLDKLYERMFENNLIKIITPFSSVEIAHVAKLINMSETVVERKLSQMILDKKFNGILDQGLGILEIFEAKPEDSSYTSGMSVISNMGEVVEVLMARGKAFNRSGGASESRSEDKKDDKANADKGAIVRVERRTDSHYGHNVHEEQLNTNAPSFIWGESAKPLKRLCHRRPRCLKHLRGINLLLEASAQLEERYTLGPLSSTAHNEGNKASEIPLVCHAKHLHLYHAKYHPMYSANSLLYRILFYPACCNP